MSQLLGLAPTDGRDRSLSLLWRISDEALDPGYQEADADPRGRRSGGYGHSAVMALALLLLGALLTAAAVQTIRGAPAAHREREDLTARVLATTATVDE